MGEAQRIYEFSDASKYSSEDLIFIFVKFLLRRNLKRGRRRANEKTRLRTIDVFNAEFACWLPFEGAFSAFGNARVDFVSWVRQGEDRR